MRNGPRFHIVADDMPLCRQRSFTAQVNSADCQCCNRRLEKMLDILKRLAEGKDPAIGLLRLEALNLLGAMGYEVVEEPVR